MAPLFNDWDIIDLFDSLTIFGKYHVKLSKKKIIGLSMDLSEIR